MSSANLFRLVLLAAIWGASFLFMRIAAPVLGAAWLVFFRVGLAALFLWGVALVLRRPLALRANWRAFLVLGLLNSALPFLLFAYAARLTPASLLAVLNATAPIWAALIGALLARSWPEPRVLGGLALGIAGVALLAGVEVGALPAGGGLAVLAGIGAAVCYGIASQYTRRIGNLEPHAGAFGNLAAATLYLAPLALLSPLPEQMPPPGVLAAVVALGVLCSGVAFLLYFRLVAEIGPVRTLTVTYLIPLFGVLWGVVFLAEQVGWHTLVGGLTVLAGTALVTGIGQREKTS